MLRALSTAATGMEAEQTKIDVISNNLANVNTGAFKKSRAEFQDLLYQTVRAPGAASSQGYEDPTGMQIGLGTRTMATARDFSTGDIKQTNSPLDVAIEGDGFIQVSQPNGEVAYTRSGNLKMSAQGQLVTSDGMPIEPNITIPSDAQSFTIGSDGTVSATIPGQTTAQNLGQIQLATFVNPAGLQAMGHNLYLPSPASGQANVGKPGDQGRGTLMQGALEMSNVKVVEEMVDLIAGQRAYDVNSRVIQAADDMLKTTAELR